MTSIISVIVPVYNVERYLPRCIDSILSQTFTDFELILIDDGSPDDSGRICDEYAARDPRIRVIHQENAGVSNARNHGINIAQGEYVCFVDPDDFILPKYFEKLFETIKENDADIASCGYFISYYENGQLIERETRKPTIIGTFSDFAEPLTELYKQSMYFSAWKHLFRKNVIIEKGLTFPQLRRSEDTCFVHLFLNIARSIAICAEPLYDYAIYLTERTSATDGYTQNYFNCYFSAYQTGETLCNRLEKINSESTKNLKKLIIERFWNMLCDDLISQICRGQLSYRDRLTYIKTCLSEKIPSCDNVSFSGMTDRLLIWLVKRNAYHRLVWLGYVRNFLHK